MKKTVQAFTLVELLVVMALILILMALVGSGLWKIQQKARITRARVDMRSLEQAIRSYVVEYDQWPGHPTGLPANQTWGADNYNLIKYLISSNPVPPYENVNLRHRVFWESQGTIRRFTTAQECAAISFYDSWGIPYSIEIDPSNSVISVTSAGPDKNINTTGDNVSYTGK